MDANEYRDATPPTKKLESLLRFKIGLFELRASGYSYNSLSDWLSINSINVSEHTVRRFFSKHKHEYQTFCKDGNNART